MAMISPCFPFPSEGEKFPASRKHENLFVPWFVTILNGVPFFEPRGDLGKGCRYPRFEIGRVKITVLH